MSTALTEAERARLNAGVLATLAVAEAIRELGSVPSGHLYARLMGQLSVESYGAIIRTLKGAGLVEEKSHLLTWVGPALEMGETIRKADRASERCLKVARGTR
jgi:hypothetical protein